MIQLLCRISTCFPRDSEEKRAGPSLPSCTFWLCYHCGFLSSLPMSLERNSACVPNTNALVSKSLVAVPKTGRKLYRSSWVFVCIGGKKAPHMTQQAVTRLYPTHLTSSSSSSSLCLISLSHSALPEPRSLSAFPCRGGSIYNLTKVPHQSPTPHQFSRLIASVLVLTLLHYHYKHTQQKSPHPQ